MIREGHLETYDLTLTVRSPLFIGSGKSYPKKEYVYLQPELTRSPTPKVMLLNENRFFSFLVERGLIDAYESFILGPQTDLFRFLSSECHLSLREMQALSRCVIDAADALDEKHSLKEIYAFVRNSGGRAYVPGSSVKGALRTVILTDMVLKEPEHHSLPDTSRGFPESKYLNTLKLKTDKFGSTEGNAVNDIMRGLYLSDSLPVDDSSMMLAGKIDADIYGRTHRINLCRECLKPGTLLHFKLTLDQSVIKGRITVDSLMQSIQAFDDFYTDAWVNFFDAPARAAELSYHSCLILGGGAGFPTKTLIYPYLDETAGVREVASILNHAFKKHQHTGDVQLGISPRTAKYAQFRNTLYPYGLCEVKIT